MTRVIDELKTPDLEWTPESDLRERVSLKPADEDQQIPRKGLYGMIRRNRAATRAEKLIESKGEK